MTLNDDPTTVDARWGQLSATHDPRILAHFHAHPTDVLITTAAKAGTTWMQQILYQLRVGGDPGFRSIFEVVPWLECVPPGQNWRDALACYQAMPEPRLFKTHCTYEQTPGTDTVRIILSSRDPRDCCVSFYHHLMNQTDAARSWSQASTPESFDSFFETWLDNGAWFRNISSWWPHHDDSNVLWLRYQDMKNDLGGVIDRILEFLDWSLDSAVRGSILEYCSFEWMQQHGEKFTRFTDGGAPLFRFGGFIRKGAVGSYHDLLNAEQERRILQEAAERLPDDCLYFIGLPDV